MTYIEELKAAIKDIRKRTKAGVLPLEQRMSFIEQATTQYAVEHAKAYDIAVASGKIPPINYKDVHLLQELADLVLYEDLTDATPYKIHNTEYPFMNARMSEDRAARDTVIGAADKESERLSVGYRRARSVYENAFMDRTVRAQNKERRKKYRDFVNGKTEGVLHVVIKEEK